MRVAINAARAGVGRTFPKPSVGAVVVKDSKIISIARTADGGAPHAEPQAIEQAGKNVKGATLYVTLEPCNHHGKTPPCADAVIAAGIKKIVIANRDINPVAAGGIEKLRNAGIEVVEGVCEAEALEVNKAFFSTITKKRPYVIVKIGATLDGKIALSNGESKYITSEISRNYVQVLRSQADGILVGINTVINDNPQLTCRLPGLEKKLPKIILDTNHRIQENCRLLQNAKNDPVIIFTSREGKSSGAEVIKTPMNKNNNFIDIKYMLKKLAEKGFQTLLVEGGGKVISSFLSENLVDELQIVYSPKILGNTAISFSSEFHLSKIPENQFRIADERRLGDDILVVLKNKNPG
jgi:diaminohydroxyphosphoribosylaminopyrimidine deaminase/5-amino-6-(5-phosphoribosylamino)uracil reductase